MCANAFFFFFVVVTVRVVLFFIIFPQARDSRTSDEHLQIDFGPFSIH